MHWLISAKRYNNNNNTLKKKVQITYKKSCNNIDINNASVLYEKCVIFYFFSFTFCHRPNNDSLFSPYTHMISIDRYNIAQCMQCKMIYTIWICRRNKKKQLKMLYSTVSHLILPSIVQHFPRIYLLYQHLHFCTVIYDMYYLHLLTHTYKYYILMYLLSLAFVSIIFPIDIKFVYFSDE